MFGVLVLGGYSAVIFTFLIALYLGIKEYRRPDPITKEDLNEYFSAFESTMNTVTREMGEDRKQELFESELRTYDRFRRKFKEYKSNN